jgi:hypothetical protein
VARRTRHTWRSKPDSPPSPNPERPAEIDPTPSVWGQFFSRQLSVPKSKKPKVAIKRQNTSLGWAYRIYVGGSYVGIGLTRKSAEGREVNARHLRTDSRLG